MAGARDGFALLYSALLTSFTHFSFFVYFTSSLLFCWPFFSDLGCFIHHVTLLVLSSRMCLCYSTFYLYSSTLLYFYLYFYVFLLFIFYFTSPSNCIMSFFPFLCQKRLMTFIIISFDCPTSPHLTSPNLHYLTVSNQPNIPTHDTYLSTIPTCPPPSFSPTLHSKTNFRKLSRVCRKKIKSTTRLSAVY
ncbi:hypothetical protein HOY80DRAFT_617215 [Tuber brumale]|nr:hypothetical protein HOY80DRAFT_617215 [Tuber brumale]